MNTSTQALSLSTGFWQKIDFFRDLSPELLKEILFESEIVDTNSRKNVFYEGEPADHFGFVVEGVFKLHRTDQLGQRVAMDFVTPGGMIAGLLMAAEGAVYPVNVHSIKTGKFLKIPKSTYNKFWCHRPEIMKKVQIANMERVRSLQLLRESQRLPLEQKVAWVIVKLMADFREKEKFLKIYFTRVDIADAVGAAPESVIRVFGKWLKDGLILIRDNEEFADLEKLKQNYFSAIPSKN